MSEDVSLCKEQIVFQKAAIILETFSHGGRVAGLIQDVKQVDRIVYFPEVLVDLLTINLNSSHKILPPLHLQPWNIPVKKPLTLPLGKNS